MPGCSLAPVVEHEGDHRHEYPWDCVVDRQVPEATQELHSVPEEDSAVQPVVDRERYGEVERDPRRHVQPPLPSHAPKDEVGDTGDGHQYHNIEERYCQKLWIGGS